MVKTNRFGLDIRESRRINLDEADNRLAESLDQVIGVWRSCINCGSCVATCPSGQNSRFNFRQLHYRIRQSIAAEEADQLSLQSCMLCGKCQLACPRGIPTRYLSIQIMQLNRQHAKGIPSI
jgi:heterodisulfide reductase subunit C